MFVLFIKKPSEAQSKPSTTGNVSSSYIQKPENKEWEPKTLEDTIDL